MGTSSDALFCQTVQRFNLPRWKEQILLLKKLENICPFFLINQLIKMLILTNSQFDQKM